MARRKKQREKNGPRKVQLVDEHNLPEPVQNAEQLTPKTPKYRQAEQNHQSQSNSLLQTTRRYNHSLARQQRWQKAQKEGRCVCVNSKF